jgi:outer membrane protein OmpA-like peptidoglycan-associated protein
MTFRMAAIGLSAAAVAGAFACRPVVQAQRPAPVDTDGGARDVDAGAAEREELPPADTDGDGIPDSNDRCPDEPEDRDGFEDDDGCPDPDNDHDRILDQNDKCPNEPETYNNLDDDDGCPDKGSVHLLPIRTVTTDPIDFDEGSSAIRPDVLPFLDKLAAGLIANPAVGTVTIVGHADRRERHARALAAKRAEVVRAGLTARTVPWQRLRTQTVAPDDRPCMRGVDCARIHRRVEFQFAIDDEPRQGAR